MSAVEVPRIERPRRQSRFRSADMTADRSGGTSTGSLYTGRSSTVRQCYYRRCSIRLRLRGYTHHGGTHRSAMASCRPSMRVCPDIPASNPRKTVPHLRGKHRRRPEHKPDITTRLRPHCNSPQPQHGPDGIACTTPATRRTPSQPADQGGCTVDITAGGCRTGFLTRRAKRRDYALSARPRSRTCVA